MKISLSAFAPENLVSRDGLNLVLTYGISIEFRGGVNISISNHHTPSGQSRVYRVTHLWIDGVHCRESAGIGPVNLEGHQTKTKQKYFYYIMKIGLYSFMYSNRPLSNKGFSSVEHKQCCNIIVIGKDRYIYILQQVRRDIPLRI